MRKKRNNGPRLLFEEIRYPVFIADVGSLITGDFQSAGADPRFFL